MNSNRRCSHCGELGHNSRTCQDGAVKLFGVTLSTDAQPGLSRSSSAGNLVSHRMSPEPSSAGGRDGCGFRYRASPLGREASLSAREETEALPSHLANPSKPTAVRPPATFGHLRTEVSPVHSGTSGKLNTDEDLEEQEGRSEHVLGTGASDEADGTRLLQTDEKMLSGEADGYHSDNGGGPDLTAAASKERKKGVPWTEDEHRLFLLGLSKLGKGDWRGISRNFVQTRTPTQVASHAQKYFIRQNNINKRKRRASLLDISTDSIYADTGMLRSHSTPSLPSLAEDFKTADSSSAAAPASGLPPFPLPGTPSFPQPLTGSPGLSPPFGTSSLDIKMLDTQLMEHAPLYKAPDYVPFLPGPTSSLYSHPQSHFYSNHLGAYPQDPTGFLSTGFRPPNPYMDFGRSQSYPVVAPPTVTSEAVSISRPNSLPTLGSAAPVATSLGASIMEGVWPPGVPEQSGSPFWSQLYEGVNSKPGAQDDQALAAMDPALRHRLGHEMMMEMMGRQLSHRMAADYSRVQASAMVGVPGTMGLPEEVEAERRSKVLRPAGLPSAGVDTSPLDVTSSHSTPFIPPPLSTSHQDYRTKFATTMSSNSVAAAAAAAAAGATPMSSTSSTMPPPWYMGPAYNSWMAQYGAPVRPTPGLMQSYSWATLPHSAEGAHAVASQSVQEPSAGGQFVLRPTAVVSRAPVRIPKAGSQSEGTDTKDSEQEPAAALVMLSKGVEVSSLGERNKAREVGERETPRTLQLFDVSERPSAFHPQPCPSRQLSPDSGELCKSPISVP